MAHELVKVAILWEEQWTARIHEAHAHYLKADEAGESHESIIHTNQPLQG